MVLETANRDMGPDVENIEANGSNPDISEEEHQEVLRVMKKFYKFKKYRARYDKSWMEYYRLFRGVHWSSKRPYWKNSEIVNFIWQTIQSQVPLQTDVRPKFEFLPREPSDKEFASIVDSISDSDWDKNNWMNVLLEVLYDGWIYGTSYSSMHYDPTLDFGVGSAVYKSEDPFYIYPDPESNDINDPDSEGFFKAYPQCTERLKRRFPKFADRIKSDVVDFVRRERTNLRDFQASYFNSDRQLPEGTFGDAHDDSQTDKTFVIEGYFKPKDTIDEKYEDEGPDGEVLTKYRVKRKYPNGRHVVIANGMILHDGELPYEDNLIPFSKFNNYILPREFFGVSEIEQLESPQRIFNKMLSFTLDAWALTGNPVWIIDNNADVDTDSGMVNVPGSIIEKNPGTEVRQMQGVGMNPGLLQVIDRLESWFNKVSGVADISSAESRAGVTAASAIEQLISIGRIRVRQKQRNLDAYLNTVGRQYLNRVFEFYSVPQMFRITNNEDAMMFRKFRVEPAQDENGEMVRAAFFQDFEEDEETGKMLETPERKMVIKGNFDIRVKSGSDLPFEIADIERKSLALFDRGIIDEEEVLDKLQVPNKEKILQRLAERQQAAAQAAAQQQGAG